MDLINTISNAILAITALIAVFFGIKQIVNLNKNLNYSNIMTIIEIEFELNRRKERLSDIRNKNLIAFQNIKESKDKNNIDIKNLDGHRKEAYENYLNLFDRLCSFILNEKLNEEDFKIAYRDMLFSTIENDKEQTFNNVTHFRNMLKLYNKWKEE